MTTGTVEALMQSRFLGGVSAGALYLGLFGFRHGISFSKVLALI